MGRFASPTNYEFLPNYECMPPRIARFVIRSKFVIRRKVAKQLWFLFLRLLRCFTSPGWLARGITRAAIRSYSDQVSPFGHRRIKGCSPPPRRVSPARHVLHRPTVPRHPPYALCVPRHKVSGSRTCCSMFLPLIQFSIFHPSSTLSEPPLLPETRSAEDQGTPEN